MWVAWKSRAGRVVTVLILADLLLALLALVAYKLWIYPEGRPTFLLLVNLNMLACAGAALAGVVLWRRAARDHGALGWLLLLTLAALLAGEAAAFALEFLPDVELPGAELALTLAGRLGAAAVMGPLAWRPPGDAARAQWSTAAALLAAAGAVWGLTLVWYPLWLDGKAEAPVAAVEVLALILPAAALRRGGAGGQRPAMGRLLALVGLGLYLLTDLYYLEHAVRSDPSFVVAEIGFYAGYLAVASMGLLPAEADEEPG